MSVLACLVLVGCSPAPKPIVTVERSGEAAIRLLITPCPGYVPMQVFVSPDAGVPHWSAFNDRGGTGPYEIELLKAPDGWSAGPSKLAKFESGITYEVNVMGGHGSRGVGGDVSFDLDQLAALEEGEVLASEGKTVKREDFLKPDSDRCEP
ncbi:hypothetical protein ABT144_04510 [Streptomyces sp. NPDC002039]|uniref:hypothetical protein n=1 Tax=Streptomyces sp. NPDC002039 TaxID=3154660 RepID=UPI003320B57E